MTYDVYVSEQAELDLRGIYEYIACKLLSPENASSQLDRLEKSIDKLNFMPKRFRAYNREPWHGRGLRVMPVDNYLVFYIPDDDLAAVTVIRVMYSGRDVDRELEQNI